MANANCYNLGAPMEYGGCPSGRAGVAQRTLCVNLWTNLCAATDVNVSEMGRDGETDHCLPGSLRVLRPASI